MTQLTDKVFAVELPDGAKDIGCEKSMTGTSYLFYKHKDDELLNEYEDIKLPPGTWRFLFTTKDVKKIPNGIVECKIVEYDGEIRGTRFVNYTNPNQRTWFINKKDSLNSLLRSKGLDDKNNYALIEKL